MDYQYNLIFYGSENGTFAHRIESDSDKAILKVVINGVDKYLDNYHNASNTIQFNGIRPEYEDNADNTGYAIHFSISAADKYTIARWGMWNAMIIQAYKLETDNQTDNSYYAMAGTDLSNKNNWNTSTDGTGDSPSSFAEDGVNFVVQNNPTATLSSALDITGTGSKLVIEGNNTITVAGSVNALSFAGITVDDGATINFSGNSNPMNITIGSDGLVLKGNSTLDIGDNNLIINGTGTINKNGETGKLASSGGSITLNSATDLGSNLYFDGTNNTVQDLTLNTNQAAITNLMSTLKVKDIVKLNSGELNTAGGDLVLMSYPGGTAPDGTGPARLAKVEDNASFTGNLTMQRYWERSQYGYYYIGTPIQNQTVSDWIGEFWIQGTNTQIPGAWTNISTYDETTGTWTRLSTDSDPILPGQGVSAFMFNSNFSDGFIRYDNTGVPVIGDFSFPLTYTASLGANAGWNLISNPYPSDIDWNLINWTTPDPNSISNVGGAIYVWDGQNSQYESWVNGTGDPINKIASGQGFFVRTTGSNPKLIISEDIKIDEQATFMRKAKPQVLELDLTNQEGKYDKAYVSFIKGASPHFDPLYDALKLHGTFVNLSSLDLDENEMAINSLPLDSGGYDIPLNISVAKGGSHTLAFKGMDGFEHGTNLFFVDKEKGLTKKIEDGFQYTFDIPSSATGNSEVNDRFMIVSKPPIMVKASNAKGLVGKTIEVPVTVDDFDDIVGAQFAISWDTAALGYVDVNTFNLPGMSKTNFGTGNSKNGSLSFVWEKSDAQATSLPKGTALFTISFRIKNGQQPSSKVRVDDSVLKPEFYDHDLNSINYQSKDGTVVAKHLFALSGKVLNLRGAPIENAGITITSDSVVTHRSQPDGQYYFDVVQDDGLKIEINKNPGEKNSVSVLDVLLAKRKLLGIRDFDVPLQSVAADINHSGTVDVMDLAMMNKMILGEPLPEGTDRSMKFMLVKQDSGMVQYFNNGTNLSFGQPMNTLNILGTYPGDIDTGLNGNRKGDGQGVAFNVELQDRAGSPNDEIDIPIEVNNFNNIAGYQFTVNWDSKAMQLLGTTNNELENQFNDVMGSQGKLSVIWSDDNGSGVQLKNGSTIITLRFKITGDKLETTKLNVDSSIIPGLAVTGDLSEYSIGKATSNIYIEDPSRQNYLIKGYPNPFDNETIIGFVLSQKQMVGISVINSLGQVVDHVKQEFDRGLNHWDWKLDERNLSALGPGIYYVQVEGSTIFDAIRIVKK